MIMNKRLRETVEGLQQIGTIDQTRLRGGAHYAFVSSAYEHALGEQAMPKGRKEADSAKADDKPMSMEKGRASNQNSIYSC